MNIKVNLTKKLVETLTREVIAENKAKKVFMEEEKTLSPETEKLVQGAINALKKTKEVKVDENLISDGTAEIIMKAIVTAYGAAVALGVGNLVKIALTSPKQEVEAAFKQIAADLREKHGGGTGGSKYGGGIGGTPQK
jgi:hypothetical protein